MLSVFKDSRVIIFSHFDTNLDDILNLLSKNVRLSRMARITFFKIKIQNDPGRLEKSTEVVFNRRKFRVIHNER